MNTKEECTLKSLQSVFKNCVLYIEKAWCVHREGGFEECSSLRGASLYAPDAISTSHCILTQQLTHKQLTQNRQIGSFWQFCTVTPGGILVG